MKNLLTGALLLVLGVVLPFSGFAQFSLSGRITDRKGEGLVAAVVRLSPKNQGAKGTTSDQQGNYRIENIVQGNYLLSISFVGFKTIEKEVAISGNTSLDFSLDEDVAMVEQVTIIGQRDYPITRTEVSRKELQKQNLGQDLPILLNFTPSIVTTSDAGAGIGYTGMRIRGSDATRTNVTINGIPLNDAESQGTFWVNTPDFASSVQNVQIQRGVGTSTNGAGAFGASVNIATATPNDSAYVEANNAYGSFNTWKHNVLFGTGLIKGRFKFDGRLSKITSDGFVDRAFSDLKSFFVSGMYKGKHSSLTLNVFSGQERTYQAWNGVPESILAEGRRTYNEFTYDNQTDNYQQDHYQLLYANQLTKKWTLNTALHYTRGKGYYEEYKEKRKLADYGIDNFVVGKDTIKRTDLIRRKWLDNDFYGMTYSLSYSDRQKLDFVFGGAWNQYDGDHYGEVIWAAVAGNSQIRHRYYFSNGLKTDFNMYAKADYKLLEPLNVFLDLQYRRVNFAIDGKDDDLNDITLERNFNFFNPKAGLTYSVDNNRKIYASFSIGNREPNRSNFIDRVRTSLPTPETLRNLEIGYRQQSEYVSFNANYYLMDYKNQLVLTGELNDVGNPIMVNVARSYRTGVELAAVVRLGSKVTWNANATFSSNKIREFTQPTAIFDNENDFNYERDTTLVYSNTDIAFSPSVIAGSQLSFVPFKNFTATLLSKYVGKQYMDNTSTEERSLDAYFTNDVRLDYAFSNKTFKNIGLSLLVNNIFNTKYQSNGYTYFILFQNGRTPSATNYNYYYPQAGTNFLVQLTVRF